MIYNQGYETNLYKMRWQFPEIPRPRPIVHLHYLGHFGASAYICTFISQIGSMCNRCTKVLSFAM